MADGAGSKANPEPSGTTPATPLVDPLAPTPESPDLAGSDGPHGLDALLRPDGARPAHQDRRIGRSLTETLAALRDRIQGVTRRPVGFGGGTGQRGRVGRVAASPRARDVALSLLVVLAAVSVVLATRSGRPATSGVAGDQPAATTSVAPTGAVRVVARERAAAGGMTLTVSVPGAPRAAALPPSAFEVSVDGRPTATTVQPVAPAGQNLAVVVDTSADATRADLQTAGNGLTELVLQLPTGSRVAVIGTAGPALIQPMTADVTTAVKALDRVRVAGTSAPGAALRLAAQQVASAPRLHRAVLVNGSGTVDQKEQEVIDATLSAQMAGTPVSLVGNGTPGSDALRSALTTTGGAVYTVSAGAPLTAYDALAADFANQYRLTFPAPATSAAVTVRVNAPGVAGSVATTVDPQLP